MDAFITPDRQLWMANIAQGFLFVYGLYLTMLPHNNYGLYHAATTPPKGFKSEARHHYMKGLVIEQNLVLCTESLAYFLIAVKDMKVELALGVAGIPWLLLMIFFLLNEHPQKIGNPTMGTYVNAIVFAVVVYATVMETSYAKMANQLMGIFSLLRGVTLLVATPLHTAFWGNLKDDDDDMLLLARKGLGMHLVPNGVFYLLMMANDVPLLTCVGAAWATGLVTLSWMIPACRKDDMNMKCIYGWWVTMAVVATTLLYSAVGQDVAVDADAAQTDAK